MGRLCLQSYGQACRYDLRRQVPTRYTESSRYNGSRVYSNAAKVNLPGLDQKWQKIWAEQDPNEERPVTKQEKREKMYILPMFPYPSGNLHLGHFRNYTIPDVLARFRRMQGYDVLLPMGWDAFGLPAENAAIERGIDPAIWTKRNIEKMKTQLQAMNGSWDWSRVCCIHDSWHDHVIDSNH
jgi:leucyl-tRNA synthetase